MRNSIFMACSLFAAATMLFSCAEDATQIPMDANASPATRVDNPKKVMVYVETNDINPLNAMTYGEPGDVKFIDILNLFAANINKDSAGNPCVHFNQELAPIMANVNKYIRPLQAAGIKVNLTLLPNWQNIGFANFTPAQATAYARLVCYVVDYYGLDGISCDDEYAGYTFTNNNSYGNFITALRAEFNRKFPGQGKLITVFQWGNYGSTQISRTAAGLIDYVDHGSFGYNVFVSSCSVAGARAVPNSKFMPVAINLGNPMPSAYSSNQLDAIKDNATLVMNGGYAGMMGFNLRDNGSALPVFQQWATAMGTTVTWNNVNYTQDQTFIPGGVTITNADVPTNF